MKLMFVYLKQLYISSLSSRCDESYALCFSISELCLCKTGQSCFRFDKEDPISKTQAITKVSYYSW